MASVLPLLALVTLLTLSADLLAADDSSQSCQLTGFYQQTVENVTHQTLQIRKELRNYQQQVEKSLRDLEESVEHLAKLSAYGCKDTPKYSTERQLENNNIPESWLARPRPLEQRRLHCNQRAGDDKMLVGMSDDNGFTDLDFIKCVHYCSIHLGEERDVDVPANSDADVNCGSNEVVTAFGASDKWMEFIVRVTCRNITAGAVVTDTCQDITVTAAQGKKRDHPADSRWPAQCPNTNEEISVITGIAYNQQTSPRWQKLRCCQLRRTLTGLH